VKLIEGFQGAAFGLADGVICILGMIIGVAVATSDLKLILIAAVAGGIADALGNAIGFYMSELSERGSQIHSQKHGVNSAIHSLREVLMSGVFSFVATIFVLVVLLAPFLLLDIGKALITSILLSIALLFSLGVYVGKLSEESALRTGIKYIVLGIIGAAISYVIGDVLKIWLSAL